MQSKRVVSLFREGLLQLAEEFHPSSEKFRSRLRNFSSHR